MAAADQASEKAKQVESIVASLVAILGEDMPRDPAVVASRICVMVGLPEDTAVDVPHLPTKPLSRALVDVAARVESDVTMRRAMEDELVADLCTLQADHSGI
ncbi:unnamed protein product (mitochondrion) [Plasmodiophora brassicae]|uniref:Uncharacterized protein n=1 Tax=Plasmodiophora brassicae TaxID=37360 RepID=A0A0G4IR96_PLABS|nr:hypothetical protein PBRA_005904 [Plasmodiophora brassicae]SPQ98336.1 unnamed protein product [Plasmodiophora brassicae]